MKKIISFFICIFLLMPSHFSFGAFVNPNVEESHPPVSVKPSEMPLGEALKQFKALPKKEKKSRFKEMKKVLKQYKADKKAGLETSTNTLLLVLLAILIPPLAVYLHEGDTNNRFWISVLLTILGYLLFSFAGVIFLGSLPGIIYALIVVLGG